MIRLALIALSLLSTAGCGLIISGSREDRRTPLEKAASDGNLAEVKRLLAAGADPNGNARACPLCRAAFRTGNAEVLRALLAAGADPNGVSKNRVCWVPPLQPALYSGDLDSAQVLLDAGALFDSPCSKLSPAYLGARTLDLLVERGFNLHTVDEQGRNLLHQALAPPIVPPIETVEYLVRAGVPINARDHSGKTPLAYWRQPRYYEEHWLQSWFEEHVLGAGEGRDERDARAKMSVFLERSGAVL